MCWVHAKHGAPGQSGKLAAGWLPERYSQLPRGGLQDHSVRVTTCPVVHGANALVKDTEFTRNRRLAGHGSRTYKLRRRKCDAARKRCECWCLRRKSQYLLMSWQNVHSAVVKEEMNCSISLIAHTGRKGEGVENNPGKSHQEKESTSRLQSLWFGFF